MARVGVDFKQVSKVALSLLEANQPVTVDNVRAGLGGTGSKSTIAPLVKRWKTENVAALERAQPLLPPDLLESVQRLYESVQQRFDEELTAAKSAASMRIDELHGENGALRQQLSAQERQCQQLRDELSEVGSAFTALQKQLDAERMGRRDRDFAYASLEQRWNERTSEIGHLRAQIEKAHQQLSHFEDAAQSRWEKEREANDSKLAHANQVADVLRAELQAVQKENITSKTQLEQLALTHRELRSNYAQASAEAEQLRQAQAVSEQAVQQLRAELLQARDSVRHLQAAQDLISSRAIDAETRLTVTLAQITTLQASLDSAEQRASAVNQELMSMIKKHAAAEAELRQCRQGRKSGP